MADIDNLTPEFVLFLNKEQKCSIVGTSLAIFYQFAGSRCTTQA